MQWRLSRNDKETGRESDTVRVIVEEPIQTCAFCRGKGEKPSGSRCSVCHGKGTVEIHPPAVRCALCKGRGEERPRGNVTCNACRGKAYITIRPPIQKCASCSGTGRQRGSLLACIACRGAGVVSICPRKTETAAVSTEQRAPRPAFTFRIGEQPPSAGGRTASVAGAAARRMPASPTAVTGAPAVLASELEVLRLYARAFLTGERIILSDAARRTPAYVQLLKGSLIKKGLLRRSDSRRFEIADRGLKMVCKHEGVEAAEHGDHLAARGSQKVNEEDPVPAGPTKLGIPARVPSASRDNGLRWTTLSRI